MQLGTDWATLKSFAQARSLSIQYVTTPDTYYLWAIDGNAELYSQITIVSPTPNPSDQYDFEQNFMPSGNASPRGNYVQVLGKDSLTLTPFGAFSGTTLAANATTNWDITLPQTMTLKGAELYSPNSALGDYVSVTVLDTSNITGQGGTPTNPTVLGTYVLSWYIAPGIWNTVEDISISQPLPQGVILQLAYTSTGTTAPTAIVNFFSYVGTP